MSKQMMTTTRGQKRLLEKDEFEEEAEEERESVKSLESFILMNPILKDADFPEFQLVPKQWFSPSPPQEMTLRIDLRNCNDKTEETRYVRRINNMQLRDHPLAAYSFCYFKFQHYPIQPETQLLKKFGPLIRKLTLNIGVLFCVRDLQQLIFHQTPNLEELHMGQFDFHESVCDDDCKVPKYPQKMKKAEERLRKENSKLKSLIITSGMTPFPISWKMMFAHFPNIERIHFHGFTSKNNFLPFVEALEAKMKVEEEVNDEEDKKKESSSTTMIKDFKFDARFDNDDCISAAERLLRLPHMHLEALSIICRNSEKFVDGTDVLPKALQLHGINLQKLEIQNGRMVISKNEIDREPYPDFPFRVSSFDCMTELTLEGAIASNIHFLNQFPHLKVLLIRQNREDRILTGTDFSRMKKLVLPYLRKFEFRVYNTSQFHLSEENMKMFVKMMPNVDDFEGNLMPPGLRVVCRNWRKMRNLGIYVVNAAKGEQAGEESNDWVVKFQTRPFPNIRTLNDLKELPQGVADDPATVWTGFDELPFLKALKLEVKTCSRVLKSGSGRRV